MRRHSARGEELAKEDFMTRLIAAAFAATVAASLALGATQARAQDERPHHPSFALGFHDVDAPLGFRYWFHEQTIALDLGVGYHTTHATTDETLNHWQIEAG